jgi:hypothetical protein
MRHWAGVVVAASFVSACSTATSGAGPELGDDAATIDVFAPGDAGKDVQGLDDSHQPTDAKPGSDAAPDGPVEAAPPSCDGLMCNGTCIHASDCSTCAGAPLLCRRTGTCDVDCKNCGEAGDAGQPIECFACDSTHAHPIGTCESEDSPYCLGGDYFGAPPGTGYHCGCPSGDAGDCPGSQQVCFQLNGQNLCAACGEPIPLSASGGTTCKTGTSCNSSAHSCQ